MPHGSPRRAEPRSARELRDHRRGRCASSRTEVAADIEAIIEVPQGSRNKYEMDADSGRIRLDRMLFTSTRYPVDYGFIPATLGRER
jgi:hypothetical protein